LDFAEFLGLDDHGVGGDEEHAVLDADVAGGADDVAGGQRGDDLLGGDGVGPQAVGVDAEDDGAGVAAEGGRSRDAGEGGEHGSDLEEGLVLDLADGLGVGGEDEVADGDGAGVEAHDEGGDGAGGHEGAGAVDVLDGLGHGLGHVGTGVEEQFHEGEALDVLRLDVVDAADVEEVVLVVVGEQTFHLGGVHAAVGLADVDDGQVQAGEDVDLHARQGEAAGEDEAGEGDEDGDGVAEGEDDRVEGHRSVSLRGESRRAVRRGLGRGAEQANGCGARGRRQGFSLR